MLTWADFVLQNKPCKALRSIEKVLHAANGIEVMQIAPQQAVRELAGVALQ